MRNQMKPQQVVVTRVVDKIKKQKKFDSYSPKPESSCGSKLSILA